MNKMNEKEIQRRFETLTRFELSPEVTARDLKRVKRRLHEQDIQPRNIWRTIMHSKVAKLTAAAAILIIAALIGLWPQGGVNGRVYAMSDVPQLFYSADTIHMKGRMYLPASEPELEQVSVKIEYWLDLTAGRWRLTHPNYSISPDGTKITISESICDGGEYEINVNHTNKSVSYSKISEYQRLLFNRRNVYMLLQIACGDTSLFDYYEIVGEEIINEHTYDIWEALVSLPEFHRLKMRSWLSPTTGEFAKVRIWMQQENGVWLEKMEINSVERNYELPNEIFSMQAPPDYTLENTRETATVRPIASVGGSVDSIYLQGHVLFSLPDGSVILCWSSEDKKSTVSQEELFINLIKGKEFPLLPLEVYALKTHQQNEDIIFHGVHLTYTKKGGKFYEWGLYVPTREIIPGISQVASYILIYRDNVPDSEFKASFRLATKSDLFIENEEDFNTFVLGAMAELSDDGAVPDHVSYENVLCLAEEIRRNPQ